MREFRSLRAGGDVLKEPSKDRPEQSAKGEIQKIDYPCRGTAELRRIRFLDHGVWQHRSTRSNSGDQADQVRGKDICRAEEDPYQTDQKHKSAGDDHRLPSPYTVRNKTKKRT